MSKNATNASATKHPRKPRTEYAIFAKRNGRNVYQCSSLNEDDLIRDLNQMYREHCSKYRHEEDSRKVPPFTVFGLVINGLNTRVVNVSFASNHDDEETYEDVVAGDIQ